MKQPDVISYRLLRRLIGILGIALPFIMVLGTGFHESISSYYYYGKRDELVGMLCAIGVFLACYKGYEPKDGIAVDFAGIFAIGIALCPTKDPAAASPTLTGILHYVFAGLFFLTLAYVSLRLFTKTHEGLQVDPASKKASRNKVYKTCGYVIIACIALMVVGYLLPVEIPYWLFVLESVAVVAFGISWLTKGEMVFKD